jgi:hypothetical protein
MLEKACIDENYGVQDGHYLKVNYWNQVKR